MALGENEITETTTLVVTLTVNNADNTARNLTGSTYSASFGRDATILTGTVTAVDATNGIVRVAFPAATGLAGQATASLTITQSGEAQTVWRQTYKVFRVV